MRSLTGAAADMAQYMGPTASVSDILEKLLVYFQNSSVIQCIDANF